MLITPSQFHRKSIRLPGFDYTEPGYYFVTINTNQKYCYFGKVIDSQMIENDAGKMVGRLWHSLPTRFPNISTQISKVMPNHFHGILVINQKGKGTLGAYIATFKSLTTREYIMGVKNQGWQQFNGRLWMDNFYEHIIRDEDEHGRIVEYIQDNALKWEEVHNGGIS